MNKTPRDKYAESLIASDVKRTNEMQKELDELEKKYRNEQSDIENDRINENGIEDGEYLNDKERKRMNELDLIQKTYYKKQEILEGKVSQAQIDLYNDVMNIAGSKSMFDV